MSCRYGVDVKIYTLWRPVEVAELYAGSKSNGFRWFAHMIRCLIEIPLKRQHGMYDMVSPIDPCASEFGGSDVDYNRPQPRYTLDDKTKLFVTFFHGCSATIFI
jgi:hypothetical protein